MTEYDLDFLKEKGFLESSIDMEDKCDTAEGTIKTVSYLFDPKNRLAYFDDFNVEDIASILNVLREKRNFDYYWFWKEGRIYSFRTFGENKQFIFNTRHSKKTEYVKSKKDKLSKFSSENPTALFDVKDVISLFYRRLWDLRLKLAKAIKGGLDDKERILAAQRLLDRLIFTYFIAEKGIIYGIDKRGRRLEVNARDLFKYLIGVSGDFHSLLNVLFFDYLNDSKKNDMPIQGAEGYSLFIPYLNGGLFRERHITTPAGESIGESKLEIEGFDWKELIGALNKYNWIIDGYTHAEDEETIGNLTPEILGHIYEKFVISVSELDDIDVDDLATTREGELKKGNKKIGAYYTPEVITKYIAENTIFPFAMDKLELDEKYENFVEFHEAHKGDAGTLSRFNDALKNIKVLDPAVGSGAFPMAAADILFDWRRKCGESLDDYHLRREIIINNLHGVDIMEGAVEICMLRLWLWLIAAVDTEKEIEALPNIDFNIFEGNSLIGYVDEREIADIKPKKKPKARWDTLTHKQFTMDNWGEEGIFKLFQQRNYKIREYRNASGGRAERLRKEIRQMTDEFNGLLDGKLLNELEAKGVDIDEDGLLELKPFHWVMQFSDVFENGGFDVVIGNPPYFRLSTLPIKIEKIILEELYEHITNESNAFSVFTERGIILMKKNGYFSFITHKNILTLDSYASLRKIVAESIQIRILADMKKDVFIGVTGETIVFNFKKDKDIKNNTISYHIRNEGNIIKNSEITQSLYKDFIVPFNNRFPIHVSDKIIEIINTICTNSTNLNELLYLSRGIETGNNNKYLSESKDGDKYYPILKGRDIKKFSINGYSYINYEFDELSNPRFPELNFTPKLITQQNSMYPTVFYDYGSFYVLNSATYMVARQENNNLKSVGNILNSNLISYFFRTIFTNFSSLTNNILPNNLGLIPIKKSKIHHKLLSEFCECVQFLSIVNGEEDLYFFYDELSNALVYELYFSSKFTADGIPTDLAAKLTPHLEPINYDRWAELEFKDQLTDEEMKEKQALEKKNLAAIEKVYQRLSNDKEIQAQIERIKAHPWVRVVEGE
ncbi:MAG: TaqI-like C-terminal specificity domain-containing protein [Methanosarcinales archaeon]|nr:TaqI-like C-terminal specificity domain-containing protein [Methanosarcinales archaeon]